jgi:hypothetical protein
MAEVKMGTVVITVLIILGLAFLGVKIGVIDLGTGVIDLGASGAPSSDTPASNAPSVSSGGQCNVAPAYTYSAVDYLNGVAIGGTTRIKSNGEFPVTSLASPPAGKSLQFLNENATHYCELSPKVTADCSSQKLETKCYRNSSTVTMALYSEPAHTALTSTTATGTGATNLSLAANGQASLTLTAQGTSKQVFAPFGGCLVVEVPNTVSSLTVGGLSAGCDYALTYSPASTSNIYYTFKIPAGWDTGAGDVKSLSVQVLNGGTDITAGNIVAKIIAANYYVGLDGNFYLGLQKDKNADNTRVGLQEAFVAAAIS